MVMDSLRIWTFLPLEALEMLYAPYWGDRGGLAPRIAAIGSTVLFFLQLFAYDYDSHRSWHTGK